MQNHSNENEFDLHENELVGGTHFHINGLALRLVLKQRQKGNSEISGSRRCWQEQRSQRTKCAGENERLSFLVPGLSSVSLANSSPTSHRLC